MWGVCSAMGDISGVGAFGGEVECYGSGCGEGEVCVVVLGGEGEGVSRSTNFLVFNLEDCLRGLMAFLFVDVVLLFLGITLSSA